MKHAVDLLVYITGVPYELDYLYEDANITISPIDISMSKNKIAMLEEIDSQYRRIRKKRDLMETVLRLYSLSAKYTILFEDSEESYFAMFRIIEKIAKDEYEIGNNRINKGYSNIRSMVSNIINDVYGIKIPSNKLDDLAGNFSSVLFSTVFSDIYSKIAWFCEKWNIDYDENILSRAVKLRNKLAHGDNVNIDYSSQEYSLVQRLSNIFIRKKFFGCLKSCSLEYNVK